MTDHVAGPDGPASSGTPQSLAHLHALCRADLDGNASRRKQDDHRDDVHLVASDEAADARCPAAHTDDPTPCVGPIAVTVLDATNAGAKGCEHHAARLLASLKSGRVYALSDAPPGAAIRVFKAADTTRPFAWHEDAPRTQPSQLSHAENRRGGGQ